MSILHLLANKKVLKNIIYAVVLTAVIIILVFQFLKIFTRHGEYIVVEDYSGMAMEQLEDNDTINGLVFIVIDSVYDASKEKGTVILQDPLPGSKVKENRKVYLTLIAKLPEQVSMPDLKDLTLRQAIAMLETYNLAVDSLEYVPDIAQNAVLQQKYNGEIIEPGTMVEKGSAIILVLGDGLSYKKIPVPMLLGKKQAEVYSMITKASLNVGIEIFEDDVDTSHAVVYMQKPAFTASAHLNLGESIDLWYKSDEDFDLESLLRTYEFDSLMIDSLLHDTINFDKDIDTIF